MEQKNLTNREKIEISIKNIKIKNNKIFFIVTNTGTPNASTYEIYRHATTLKNEGYNIHMLTDTSDFKVPYWIEEELTNFKHESVENARLSVSPEDMLIIPETFSNVMEQTKNLPCIRVVLLQSMDYAVNSLTPAMDWSMFGIEKVITTNESLKEMFNTFYNKNFDIKIIKPIVPDYFFNGKETKSPVVSIIGRNPNEISKVVKLFYIKYPQFTWVTFDAMYTNSNPPKQLDRKGFAERLSQNFITLWVDRISSFGTVPLEAMASGSIPVGLIPDILPEYLLSEDSDDSINNYVGYWSENIYDLPIMLGKIITAYLDDSYDDEYYSNMKKVAQKYLSSEHEKDVNDVYGAILNERLQIFEKALKFEIENENKINEETNKSE